MSPQTLSQSITHNTLKESHCEICGDTVTECKILKIQTQLGDKYMCDVCYNI